MKKQFLVLFFLVFYLLSTEACNTDQDRAICASILQRCQETEGSRPTPNPEESLTAFNTQCRARVGASWRDVTRCNLVRAICEITIVRCQKVTCSSVQALIQ
ncbi:PREDICTED: uncharacterized protein LOC108968989 isoform X2 [Bactrocera latifrons]|uniref:Uncharacterized protein n=1 Tax=Bactrocera latifrons TaxID=174628 RepID=A0A0K8U585_BACLA|nr:PREDICTED: uncharacterized protein LOC108968989 isoform X2 [Bactrocera latifrons]